MKNIQPDVQARHFSLTKALNKHINRRRHYALGDRPG